MMFVYPLGTPIFRLRSMMNNLEVSGLSLIFEKRLNVDAYNEKPYDKHIYF